GGLRCNGAPNVSALLAVGHSDLLKFCDPVISISQYPFTTPTPRLTRSVRRASDFVQRPLSFTIWFGKPASAGGVSHKPVKLFTVTRVNRNEAEARGAFLAVPTG